MQEKTKGNRAKSAMKILGVLWGLFDTTVRLEAPEDRQAICALTQEIMDFHGLDLRVPSN